MRGSPRVSHPVLALLAIVFATTIAALCGCGGSAHPSSSSTAVPSYVEEPFTPEQKLVERGARLVIADGCSACHLGAAGKGLAPSFLSLAGHRVRLSGGGHAVVTQSWLERGLRDPAAYAIAGYDASSMVKALARLHFASHPSEVKELAAFIEQIGPEDAPE